jgi:8-oxo-dGTP pyrophosphatase MutT (NUDIX family)
MVQKVQAFIYRKALPVSELLVFWSDVTQCYQLVRGTLEANEEPEAAVLREIKEEAGLTNLFIEGKLGEKTLRIRGGPKREGPFEDQVHHGFLIRPVSEVKDRWTHIAQDCDAERGLAFHFSWLPIDENLEQRIYDDFRPFIKALCQRT